jgi:FAD:protein FMN transferase
MRRLAFCIGFAALLTTSGRGYSAGSWKLEAGSAPLARYESVEPHMGTLVKITVYARDEDAARAAFKAGFGRIRELDDTLSDYKPGSELNRVTAAAVGKAVPVSRDLFTVLVASQELAAASDGAFDVTQGPVIRVWREARRTKQVPDDAALRAAAARGGFRKLHLDAARRTVLLDDERMALDVGGIAKGYAASEALDAIGRTGVRSALVAVSGDLAFSDAPPDAGGWRISLHDVGGEAAGVPAIAELSNAAVSTAGKNEQHLDAGGRRYSHIIDPRSGMGLTEDLTVTVIARNGLAADGLDTAISVLGIEKGLALIDARADAVALIVRRTPAGDHVLPSARFRSFIRERQG